MPNVTLDSIVQGDSWTQLMSFTWTGHNFTTPLVTARSRMTSLDDCDTYHDFTMVPTFAAGETGTFSTTLSLSGSESNDLTIGIWNGDVVLEQTGTNFGPFTALSYTVSVVPRYTPYQ